MNNTTLTLSGKYVVSKLEINYDSNNAGTDSLYTLGSTYINRNSPSPFDSIKINGFKINLSYIDIKMNLLDPVNNRWEYGDNPVIFYRVLNNNGYDLGYLQFDYTTKNNFQQRITFHIEHDGLESLQLKSVGEWPNGKYGPKIIMTMFLTRIGP